MKFPEHKLFLETARLPSPVQKWFGHQLEIRGIDSVIYSRHVIHLLQQDDEEIQDYVDLFFDSKADKRHHCKPGRYDKKKLNSEERKKSAAIECLQAVSDEDNDIEKLVEELCHKLKTLEQHDGVDGTVNQEQTTASSSESDCSSSEVDNPTQKYFDAFPALGENDSHTTPTESQSVWRNNPITKPKPSQTGETEAGVVQQDNQPTHQQQDQLSPKTQTRKKKKHTVHKLNMSKIPSRREDAHERVCRFLSWPNETSSVEMADAHVHSLQEKEICSQVESMLKNMLLQNKKKVFAIPTLFNQSEENIAKLSKAVGAERTRENSPRGMDGSERAFEIPTLFNQYEENIAKPNKAVGAERTRENSPRGTDGSVSPELQEDDSWYTQPLEILYTSEEPKQRLYKRNNSSPASPFPQKSDCSTPVSSNDSPNDSLMQQSFNGDDFFLNYTSNSSETGFSNNFSADLSHSLFEQSMAEAIRNTALNTNQSMFLAYSPYDNLPPAATTTEREESDGHLTHSSTENNLNSLTTVRDLEDIRKRMEDLYKTLVSEKFTNSSNNQNQNNNLPSYDAFLSSSAETTWPSKVLMGYLIPGLGWCEKNESYTPDFHRHLKFGKIWQVWDVNYLKITSAYCSPLKNQLPTYQSDRVLFGMSSCWDPFNPDEQTEIWSSWDDYKKLKESYEQNLVTEDLRSVETSEDSNLQEDQCNPMVKVDVDQDYVICQIGNKNSELIPQIQLDLVSEAGSEYDNVLSDGEDDLLTNSEDDQNCFCRSSSLDDFQTMWSMVEHAASEKYNMAKSFELRPSEGSAFENVVKKKIHHVQSEPDLRSQRRDSFSITTTNKGRSCKSGTSSPKEHLYYSKKNEFQPIQSPVATYNLKDLFGGYSPSNTPYQKFQKADTNQEDEKEETFVPMFKIRKDQDKYIQTCSNVETGGDDTEAAGECEGAEASNQKVELGQILDVFGYVENLTGSLQSTSQNLVECVNTCVDSGYEDQDQHVQEKEDTETVVLYDGPTTSKDQVEPWTIKKRFRSKQNKVPLGETVDEDAWQSVRTSKQPESKCSCGKLPTAGDGQGNTREGCTCGPPVHGWVIQEAWGSNLGNEGQPEAASKHSIWSSGHEDGVFSEMFYYPGHGEETAAEQYEMDDSSFKMDDCSEENKDNLFQHHQNVVDQKEENDSSIEKVDYEADSDPYGQSFMEMKSYFGDDLSEGSNCRPDQQCAGVQDKEMDPPQNDSDIVKVKLVIKKGKKKEDFEMTDTQPPLFKPMPVAAVYSTELEQAWMNNKDADGHFSQSVKGKRKPCTFFLEGNCRRTDCKFAHDLSYITCRFWEEGDCFKGELCPFLHGYSPFLRKSYQHASYRKESEHFKYQAEDFPNLTKSEAKKDKARRETLSKLRKYKASKTQLRTQINKKLLKSNAQGETSSLPKKLKQKGSQ